MKIIITIKVLILSFLLYSCINSNKTVEDSLKGVWQYDKHEGSIRIYKKSNDIDDNSGGMQFLPKGHLKVRQNIGWCGTPPITYETVSGTWSKISDSSFRLNYQYWGGNISEDILVVKVSNSNLQIVRKKLQL